MADYNININAKDNTSGQINKVSAGLGGLTAGAGKFKAALGVAAGAFAALGVVKVVGDKINEFDALAKSARAAGAAASGEAFEGFQVMKQAMNEAGIDAGTFDRAMLNTATRLQKGAEGAKGFSEVFDKLGPSIKTANGELKSGPKLLEAMVNGLNAGTISTDEFAKVVGGRAGPMIAQQFAKLNKGAGALEATLADVAANSNIVSLDAAENAEKFNDTIGRLQEGMGQLMTDAITPLLPMLLDLAEKALKKLPAFIDGVSTAFNALKPVLSLIGTVLTNLVFPILQKVFEVLGSVATAITPLVEKAIPYLKTAFESIVEVVKSVVGWFKGVADSIQAIYNKAVALKDKMTGAFSSAGDSISDATDKVTGGIVSAWTSLKNTMVDNSIVPDMIMAILAEFTKMDRGIASTTSNTTAVVEDAFTSLSNTIMDSMQNGKLAAGDFGGFFKDTMLGLVKDAMSGGNKLTSIFSSLFGNGGRPGSGGGTSGILGGLFSGASSMLGGLFGGGGGLGSMFSGIASGIGSLFGGFFADGGSLGAGKFGIAGEAGPELITGPARITPAADLVGGSTPAVNITIQAIDTQTGTEFLLKNKKQIEGIIQNAYNRRGKQGIY